MSETQLTSPESLAYGDPRLARDGIAIYAAFPCALHVRRARNGLNGHLKGSALSRRRPCSGWIGEWGHWVGSYAVEVAHRDLLRIHAPEPTKAPVAIPAYGTAMARTCSISSLPIIGTGQLRIRHEDRRYNVQFAGSLAWPPRSFMERVAERCQPVLDPSRVVVQLLDRPQILLSVVFLTVQHPPVVWVRSRASQASPPICHLATCPMVTCADGPCGACESSSRWLSRTSWVKPNRSAQRRRWRRRISRRMPKRPGRHRHSVGR